MQRIVKTFESYDPIEDGVYANIPHEEYKRLGGAKYIKSVLMNLEKRLEGTDINGWKFRKMWEGPSYASFEFMNSSGLYIVANPFNDEGNELEVGLDTGVDFFKDSDLSIDRLSYSLAGNDIEGDTDRLEELVTFAVSEMTEEDRLRKFIVRNFGTRGKMTDRNFAHIRRRGELNVIKFLIETGTDPYDVFEDFEDMLQDFGYPNSKSNIPWLLKYLPEGREKDLFLKKHRGKSMFGV